MKLKYFEIHVSRKKFEQKIYPKKIRFLEKAENN